MPYDLSAEIDKALGYCTSLNATIDDLEKLVTVDKDKFDPSEHAKLSECFINIPKLDTNYEQCVKMMEKKAVTARSLLSMRESMLAQGASEKSFNEVEASLLIYDAKIDEVKARYQKVQERLTKLDKSLHLG